MIRYLIVGSGYRSEYFGRIARNYPGLFNAMFLCRSEEKARLVTEHTGIDATVELQEALVFKPDFVVVAVDREHVADVTEEWVLRGFPVVAETAVGSSMEKLHRLWELQKTRDAKIVCCEQYFRHPLINEGISAVSGGMLGTPSYCYLSLVHDYHAASILRKALGTYGESYVMHGERKQSPIVETDSRYEAFYDGHIGQETRDIVHITYESGKTAVYDFASTEYRSYIRSRHITVRCERGEWNDRVLYYLNERNEPQKKLISDGIPEKYRILDSQALKDARRIWQPELQLDTLHDEYAIATILLDMKEYIAGGASPYPLEEALDDAVFWLSVQEAVKDPWKEIKVPGMPWNKK